MRKGIHAASELLIRTTHNIAAILLAVGAVLVFYQVLTRFIFGDSATWTELVARGVVVWMVFLVCGAGFRLGLMIPLEFLRSVLPPQARNAVMWTVTALTLVFLGVLVWKGAEMAIRVNGQQVPMLGVRMSLFYAAIPVGALLAIPGVLLAQLKPVNAPKEDLVE